MSKKGETWLGNWDYFIEVLFEEKLTTLKLSYLGCTRWKISLEAEMMRFMFISTVLWLVSADRSPQIDAPRGRGCSTYKVTTNVTVDRNMCAEHGSITDKISRELCVQKCNCMEQLDLLRINSLLLSEYFVELF